MFSSVCLGLSYFEDDEEESSSNVDLPYIPAENSPTRQQMQSGGGSDSEDDPLDAFMAEVEVRLQVLLLFCRLCSCLCLLPGSLLRSINQSAYICTTQNHS